MRFYEDKLKQQMLNTLLISYNVFLIHLNGNTFFKTASNFPNLDGPNAFFPNLTGPWPRLQKGRKILELKPLCIKITNEFFLLV